jgi:hypothetical protein
VLAPVSEAYQRGRRSFVAYGAVTGHSLRLSFVGYPGYALALAGKQR